MLRGYYDKQIKKQPPLSAGQIMGTVLIGFHRGHYIIIDPELRNVLMFSSIVPSLIIFIVFFCI